MKGCPFIDENSIEYQRKQKEKDENIQMYEMDAFFL